MKNFVYARAENVGSAIQSITQLQNAKFLGGGTNLVDLMRENIEQPDHLVDLTALPLAHVDELSGGGMSLGALVTNSHLAAHPLIRARYPVLAEAILHGASGQIRNMATTGGNLMQRTRCYYFYDTHAHCNKRAPGTGCDALEGYNRIHAVLGTSGKCIAAYPGDMPVAMAALDAVVHTRRPNGTERAIPLVDFHVPYGEDPARSSVLEHGE